MEKLSARQDLAETEFWVVFYVIIFYMSEDDKKISIGDYDTIMSDRNIFNQIVYTPLSEALRLLEERQKDLVLGLT
jgi:hypothetical protein